MKRIYKITLLVGITILVSSCHNNSAPNYQYFPNMYESVAYEPYTEAKIFKGDKEGQLPVEGTINRGFEPYEYENSTAGYELAKANLKSPLTEEERNSGKGKELFEIYCISCHGAAGNGKGKLVEREKFLGVPSYKDRDITEGSIFHVETYGLNAMGSHANQLSAHERWLVADYVLKLKSQL
ncbi:quinol:cytochrome c oxidoreductase monoheme cytochrome subunit [Flavobacterium sp. CF108]|jgi:mono/diheme cytochrome c family protein|uniref:c-type cytochrome n=1 Tax=Flavobacterium TaxID=237 RepID=UPI0008B0C765|nr:MULTISPECIES: cytochrome c [Flavobacterium]MDR6761256.1 mono/diheme cytochrome c family protein [Flavobacterium sp. 2755]UUF16178.1 cytochrome c [Flavobacterium panici]SEN40950.1 quinol:cytochrome c oxidoreductase monoheme cytochrome subunit [Flavobacterium sp. fv08]SHG89091.1 quinol:cytochrome c oxidoreductase monoheme cytochrome subunit [Flavobacterium sp. CF108]